MTREDRTNTMAPPGGRVVCWSEYGAPEGVPVVALHGNPGSRRHLTPCFLSHQEKAMNINTTTLEESAYWGANTMSAVGMTAMPEVARVSERLELLDVRTPRPGPGQVAIKLLASSMHIDEIYAAQGTALGRFFGPKNISADNPYILGSSVSGVIVALGEGADKFRVGDEVIVIPNETMEHGSWARYRCVTEKMVMPKPAALTHVQAAAVAMAACVAWGAIALAEVGAGTRCVVVGASGSIGVMLLQLLRLRGARVTAICSAKNESFVREHGADEVIDYTAHEFGDVLRDSGAPQDVVFDCVGGRDIEANAFTALKKTGMFVTVVGPMRYIGERRLSWWEFAKVLAYVGYRMLSTRLRGPRYVFGETRPRAVIETALDSVARHDLRMPLQSVVPFELESIVDAVELLTTHRAKGRIVIDFSQADTTTTS